MAFLEVITRAYARPKMLAVNRRSVERLGPDVLHTVLVDEAGQGMAWAQEQLAVYAPWLQGDYVWLLDDDDKCIRDHLAKELRVIVAEHDPDVIFLRMNHGPRGVLPDNDTWGGPPRCARIGCSAYVVRREVFQRHAGAWRPGHYSSDFDFISAVYADPEVTVYWHDVIASAVQRISMGEPA